MRFFLGPAELVNLALPFSGTGDPPALPVREVRSGRCQRRAGHGVGETFGEKEEAEVRDWPWAEMNEVH